jgi:hypothetical protein
MYNDQDLAIFLMMTSGILFTTTLIFSVLWLRARERAFRLSVAAKAARETSGSEIEHLVHAVDAIAVEVERISEAQRFTAQVLVERTEAEAPLVKRVPGRVITPH